MRPLLTPQLSRAKKRFCPCADSMLVKLDENLGRSHVALLLEAGHQAERVHDQGLSGEADPVVWERVSSEGRFFITMDLGFADVRRYKPGSHPGILLLRARNRSRSAVLQVLERVLSEGPLDAFRGCLVVADELQTRVRRPTAP